MPSIAKSKDWFVRIDYPHEHIPAKVKVIEGWLNCAAILAVTHDGESGENPHFHAVIRLTSELQKQSFDARLKLLFCWKKGTDYSTKPWDGKDGACSYLFHEATATVVSSKGFTPDDIQRFKELHAKVAEVVAINKERGTKKSVLRIMNTVGNDCHRVDIADAILDEIREGGMYHPGDFGFPRLVEEIFVKTRSNATWRDAKDSYIMKMRTKFEW